MEARPPKREGDNDVTPTPTEPADTPTQQPGDGDILNEETQAGKQGKDLDEESTPMQEKAEASSKSSHSLEQN